MDIVTYILLGIFAIFVTIMSLRKGNPDKGKSYEQRREETYADYERRMEEFKATEMKPNEAEALENAMETGGPKDDSVEEA